MTNSEWDKFDELIQAQFKKGQYKSYNNLDKAKLHSRNLMSKIELWFEVVENQKKEALYKKVYSDKKIIADDKKIVEELLPIALEVWPKFQEE